MPFFDKTIELVILTHPQEDHYGGLIDVFKYYKVEQFGEYNRNSSNKSYQVLRNEVGSKGIGQLNLTSGVKLRLGMMYLDILHPLDEDNSKNVNNDGIVTLLKYGQFKALFTADVENAVSDELAKNNNLQNIDYIKVNHHGSKNGLSQNLLDATSPETAVISLGKNNSYGHPHKLILDMLSNSNTKILRTDEMGDVEIVIK